MTYSLDMASLNKIIGRTLTLSQRYSGKAQAYLKEALTWLNKARALLKRSIVAGDASLSFEAMMSLRCAMLCVEDARSAD